MTFAAPEFTVEESNPQVRSAREAEERLYEHFGLEATAHRVDVNTDLQVRVVESGNGSPVLMVPGGVGDGWIWAPLMAELDGYRMLVLDRPGGGLSDGVDHGRVDVRQLAVETLTAVLDHFEISRAPIICNSMGGLWSFWFALARPERVEALLQLGCPALILNTSAPFPMRLMSVPILNQLLVKQMIPDNREDVRESVTFLGHPASVGESWPDAMCACGYHFRHLPTYETAWLSLMREMLTPLGANGRHAFGAEKLRQVHPPVLYVWGDNDPFGDLEAAREAARLTPDAELHVWQGGHLPWWDDASACGRLIREFLRQLSGRKTKGVSRVDTGSLPSSS